MIKANIISANDAGIKKENISANALKVVQDLQDAGYQAYLVGGCVRDLILNLKPKDFDVATNATPEQIKKSCRNSRMIGRRFKIVHVRFGYEVIEVATFRANASDRKSVGSNEMSEGEQGQLLRDNVYGTMEEDVVRRDFNANAMYYNPISDEILDFMNGMEDIQNKKMRSIGDPEQRFREDPVRMLRVIRFAAKLGFEMEDEAMNMIKNEGKLLSHVSPARLFEEVLKLFHGGSAFDTYLLLREYGLFQFLFPFTDSCVIEGTEGMPERALKNTDKRVNQGKPVIPAFLFACMMWDPVKADARIIMEDGSTESQAWRVAMNDGLRDQNQYVAVPRRLAEIILDIWNIHFRLIKRNPRTVRTCLNNRRFRAAYDFLLLRTSLHEVDQDIADWWTLIQEVEDAEKDEMISNLNGTKNQKDDYDDSGETDGNSINYNSDAYAAKHTQTQGHAQNRNGRGDNKSSKGRRRSNKKNPNGTVSRRHSKRRKPNNDTNTSAVGNEINSGNGPNNTNKNRRKKSSRGGRKRSRSGPKSSSENRFNDTQPADEYGNNSSDKNKKVIVRHKRKVQIKPISSMTAQNKTQKKDTDVKTSDSNKSTNSKSDNDPTPHF